MTPDVCPICDQEVPAGARACPGCGADETTGWSQGAHCERLGIPDPDATFDHGGFLEEEFGGATRRHGGIKRIWTLTALVLLVALLLWAL